MTGWLRRKLRRKVSQWLEPSDDRGVPDILTEEESAEEARRQEARGEWIAWPFRRPTWDTWKWNDDPDMNLSLDL